MKIFIQLILLLAFNSSVFSADKAPIGSWQLSTTTQLELTSPTTGKKIKSTQLKGYEFATFQNDGSYVSSEWLNKIGVMVGSSTTNYNSIDFSEYADLTELLSSFFLSSVSLSSVSS